jgi:uncharacterized spore protein YtfJ
MPGPAPFEPIGELLQRSVSIRHVYGEPVRHGDLTIIPVAKVAYGFGAGGGAGRRRQSNDDAGERERPSGEGAGGGGGVRMTPVGALEVGPAGTRFVPIHPVRPWLAAAVVGGLAAWLVTFRRR